MMTAQKIKLYVVLVKQVRRFLFLFSFMMVVNCPNAFAADYYVSQSGTASWAASTSVANPCSAVTAMNNAVAGDTVYFRGGTYYLTGAAANSTWTGSGSTYRGRLEPANSGKDGSPITFAAYPGEIPIMDTTYITPQLIGRAFGTNGEDWIIFDGFTLIANGGERSAGFAISGHDAATRSTDCTVRNCKIDGGSYDTDSGAYNVEGVRVEAADRILVENNRIANFNYCCNPGSGGNTGAIKMYNTTYVTIQNNEIRNCTSGVYFKLNNTHGLVAYNFIYDATYHPIAFDGGGAGLGPATDMSAHNNIIVNYVTGSWAHGTGSVGSISRVDRARFYNNTIYSTTTSGSDFELTMRKGVDLRFYNNIIIGSSINTVAFGDAPADYDVEECDHNAYYSTNFAIYTDLWVGSMSTYNTLAAWQSSGDLDSGVNPGVGSLYADPKFENSSGNMNQINDFILATDSPCKGAGRGGVDMGANIDLVGIAKPHSPVNFSRE